MEWCKDHEDVDVRNGCDSDESCLKAGRPICDADPLCFGVAWHQPIPGQPLKICRSTVMAVKTDGWRTMMKTKAAGKTVSCTLFSLTLSLSRSLALSLCFSVSLCFCLSLPHGDRQPLIFLVCCPLSTVAHSGLRDG